MSFFTLSAHVQFLLLALFIFAAFSLSPSSTWAAHTQKIKTNCIRHDALARGWVCA